MDNVDTLTSTEAQVEAKAFSLKSVAARRLEVTPQEVSLVNLEQFIENNERFLYGFTEPSKEAPGFFKMSQAPETNSQLERESLGLQIAHRVGIPTVGLLHPYQNTEGYGIVHVEQLDAEQGTVLTSPELLAAADPKYGARAAVALAAASGKEVPSDMDTSLLKRGDWRNESPETIWKVWEEQNSSVFDPKNNDLVEQLVGVDKLRTIVDEAKKAIESPIKAAQNPDVEYFVHNDTAPNNIYFSDTGEDVLLLDFEHAAASHNLFLAQLTDLGNYYGRMWPNPEMQQEFLNGFLAQSKPDTLDNNYQLLRTTAIFGAMYLAKYGMNPGHDEHQMSVSLLGNLEQNLASLDAKYVSLQGNNLPT